MVSVITMPQWQPHWAKVGQGGSRGGGEGQGRWGQVEGGKRMVSKLSCTDIQIRKCRRNAILLGVFPNEGLIADSSNALSHQQGTSLDRK